MLHVLLVQLCSRYIPNNDDEEVLLTGIVYVLEFPDVSSFFFKPLGNLVLKY